MFNEKHLIMYRRYSPGGWHEEVKPAWDANPNKDISKDTAEIFAKSGHRPCNGKGWLEYSDPATQWEYIVFCECSKKNMRAFAQLGSEAR